MNQFLLFTLFVGLFCVSTARAQDVQILGTYKSMKFGVRCLPDAKAMKLCEPEGKWVIVNAKCELVYPEHPELKPFKIDLNGECEPGAGNPPSTQTCIAASVKALINKAMPNSQDFRFNPAGVEK